MNQNHLPVGGLPELRMKYLEMLEDKPSYKILDVGFGTGTLSMLAINYIKQKFGEKKIVIYGIDNDSYLLNYLPKLQQEELLTNQKKILESLSQRRAYEDNKLKIRLFDKSVEHNLDELPEDFDYVFYDLFSNTKDAVFWNEDVLKKMFNKLKRDGKLATHTASTDIQLNLTRAGFNVSTKEHKQGVFSTIAAK